MIGFEIGVGIENVFESYRDGGHWVRELMEVIGGIGGSYAGSQIGAFVIRSISMAFLCTPEGWVVVLGSVIVGVLLSIFGRILAEKAWEAV